MAVARRVEQSPWWPGAIAAGLAAVVPASLSAPWLAEGGLALLALAAVVALFLGAPLAWAEWRASRALQEEERLGPGLSALGDVLALLLIAALAAPLTADLGLTGQAFALLGWISVTALTSRSGPAWAPLFAGAALVSAVVGAILALSASPPWTLLQPTWGAWRAWAPGAIVLGLLLTPAGLGQWATGPELPPGSRRIAWATSGFALLIGLAVGLRTGARFEGHLGVSVADPVADLTLTLALLAGAFAVVGRQVPPKDGSRTRWTRAGLGLLGTLWFAGPGMVALPWFLGRILPLGIGLTLLAVARFTHGARRWTALIGAALALVGAVAVPIPLPPTVGGAAAVGVTVVAIFWYVATRTVEER